MCFYITCNFMISKADKRGLIIIVKTAFVAQVINFQLYSQ